MRVLPGHWKLSVIERCRYKDWTVLVAEGRMCVHENYAPSVRKCTHGEKVTWEVWRHTLAPGLP